MFVTPRWTQFASNCTALGSFDFDWRGRIRSRLSRFTVVETGMRVGEAGSLDGDAKLMCEMGKGGTRVDAEVKVPPATGSDDSPFLSVNSLVPISKHSFIRWAASNQVVLGGYVFAHPMANLSFHHERPWPQMRDMGDDFNRLLQASGVRPEISRDPHDWKQPAPVPRLEFPVEPNRATLSVLSGVIPVIVAVPVRGGWAGWSVVAGGQITYDHDRAAATAADSAHAAHGAAQDSGSDHFKSGTLRADYGLEVASPASTITLRTEQNHTKVSLSVWNTLHSRKLYPPLTSQAMTLSTQSGVRVEAPIHATVANRQDSEPDNADQGVQGVDSKDSMHASATLQHDVVPGLTVRLKLDTRGTMFGGIVHKFPDPLMQISLTSSWAVQPRDAAAPTACHKDLGLAITLGDY